MHLAKIKLGRVGRVNFLFSGRAFRLFSILCVVLFEVSTYSIEITLITSLRVPCTYSTEAIITDPMRITFSDLQRTSKQNRRGTKPNEQH